MRYATILGSVIAFAALPAAGQTNPPPLAYIEPLPPAAVQNVQAKLQQAGVYSGRIDGIWGADSEAASERFQQQHQLQVTGQINQATAATLGVNPGSLLAASMPAPAPPPADHLLPASVRAVQARLGTLEFCRIRGRRMGPRDPSGDRGLSTGARSAARWAAWLCYRNRDGVGTGRIGVSLGRPRLSTLPPRIALAAGCGALRKSPLKLLPCDPGHSAGRSIRVGLPHYAARDPANLAATAF